MRAVAKTLPLFDQEVPPYSILIARGDVVHAGAGRDFRPSSTQECPHEYPLSMRYHVYAKDQSVELFDEVHLPTVEERTSEGDWKSSSLRFEGDARHC